MHALRVQKRKLPLRFGEYLIALDNCERFIGLVFEPEHGAAIVFITHPSFEPAIAAGGRVEQRFAKLARVNCSGGYGQHVSHRQRVEKAIPCRRH